jgi:DNA-binding beta-propeller fold protein YncE
MKRTTRLLAPLTLGLLANAATASPAQDLPFILPQASGEHGKVVIANRGSGSISVIRVSTDEVMATLPLPPGDAASEPMYVYYDIATDRVFVGDRGNDRVVAFDADTFEVEGEAPAGDGVFHMWGNPFSGQLWVNNDVDDTASVIDIRTLQTLWTVPAPADLVAAGGHPHDVVVSPLGFLAYQTVNGVDGDSDFVVQYSTFNGQELGRAAVGKDAHLAVNPFNPWLFVPCQGTGEVYVLGRLFLQEVDVLDVPGAHGATTTLDGRFFYTTNLPGGGMDGLFTIDARTLELVGQPVDTPYGVPHNLTRTPSGRKLYLTHSGDNDKVTIYRTTRQDPVPVLIGEVTVGTNPFGLDYVP